MTQREKLYYTPVEVDTKVDAVKRGEVNYESLPIGLQSREVAVIGEDGRVFKGNATNLFMIPNIETLRNTKGKEGEIVTLAGYYEAGDKEPLNYKWTNIQGVDDGGSIITNGRGSWVAQFGVNTINIKHFGVRNGDEILDRLNNTQNYLSKLPQGGTIFIPNGSYKLRGTFEYSDNIFIEGESLDNVIIESTVPLTALFRTRDRYLSKRLITVDTDLPKGSRYWNNLSNETIVNEGEILRVKSSRRFTEDFDNGKAQRDYYLDGEIFEIDIDSTPSNIKLKQFSTLDFKKEQITDADVFKANRNNGINNVTLVNFKNTTSESSCLFIRYAIGFKVGKLKTYNSNYGGIVVATSLYTDIEDVVTFGGTKDLQLNYGIAVTNGSKYTTIKSLKGSNHRHTFSSGGNGFAIPMYCDVISIVSNHTTSLGVDCHANTAYFTFHNITTDNGMLISGIGHSILNATSSYGMINFVQTGKDMYFGNIKMLSQATMHIVSSQKGDPQSYNNCYFDNIYIEYKPDLNRDKPNKTSLWETREWGINNTYNNLELVNTVFSNTKTNAQITEDMYGITGPAIIFRKGDVVNNIKIKGFSRGLILDGDNIKVGNVKLINSVYDSGSSVTAFINVSTGKNIKVNSVNVEADHSLTLDNCRYVIINSTSAGSIDFVQIDNLYYSGVAFPVGIFLNSQALNVSLNNWIVTKPITNTVNPTALSSLSVYKIGIYPDTISTEKSGLVKQSIAVVNSTVAIPGNSTASTAIDVETLKIDLNNLISNYNSSLAVITDLQSKLNAKLQADRDSGQQAT